MFEFHSGIVYFITFEGLQSNTDTYTVGKNLLLAHANAWKVYDEAYRDSQRGKVKYSETFQKLLSSFQEIFAYAQISATCLKKQAYIFCK